MLLLLELILGLLVCSVSGNREDYLKYLFDRHAADAPPKNGTDVNAALWVQDIESLDPGRGEIVMSLFLAQSWLDERLRYKKSQEKFTFGDEIKGAIWDPQLIFANSRDFKVHNSPMVNTYYHVDTEGIAWKSVRAKLTVPCNFSSHFAKCTITLHSFVYSLPDVRLQWSKSNPFHLLETAKKHGATGFRFKESTTSVSSVAYTTGTWHEMDVTIIFEKIRK